MEKQRLCFLIVSVFLLLLFCLSTSVDAKTPPFKNFNHPRLIETGELPGFIGHSSIRIVDMRTSLLDYLKGHIPNAVYLHFENLRVSRRGIPGQVPDRIFLEKLIGDSLSISNHMWVILYSEKSNPNATFLLWVLDYLGHKKVGILNGGWEKWVSEGLPTAQAFPSLLPNKFFGRINGESLAEKRWLQDRLLSKNGVIVDVRPPKQYSGQEGEELRKGHIPGARNLSWEMTLEGDEIKVWKKKEDLEKLFTELGVLRNKEVTVHCDTGREASHVYFTLKYVLGFPKVRLYRGAWVEWASDGSLPIKMGIDP